MDLREKVRKVEWRELVLDRYFLALAALTVFSAVIRFKYAFFQGMWVDEGRYSRIGIEVASHLLDYSVVWLGDITAYPPLYPYLISISSLIFGKTEFAVRIVTPLISTLGVPVTYLLGREMKNRKVGLAAAALLSVNFLYWFLSTRILVGATLTVIYTAAVFALYYGMEDKKYSRYALWALGPITALAVLTKQPAYTLGLLVPGYFLYRKRDEIMELVRERDLRSSRFYRDTLTDRDYYIGAGLGVITLAPWLVRNLTTCGSILCGTSRAIHFAVAKSQPAWESTGGPFYYFFNMPAIITPYAAALLAGVVAYYAFRAWNSSPDLVVKKTVAALAVNALAYFTLPRLIPGLLLASVMLYAPNREEKLLWGWIALGIGIMSIPDIKVNRYIVFTIPALLTVLSINFYRLSGTLASFKGFSDYDREKTVAALMVVLVAPVLALSFAQGVSQLGHHSFKKIEPAGEWIDAHVPEDQNIAASSPAASRFYVYPRMAYRLPENQSDFKQFILENDIHYVEIDVYERAQPYWAQTGLPPYRLPVKTVQALRQGQISPQKVVKSYGRIPDYLIPVKSFGRTTVPLTDSKQPKLIIYRVNRSSLR
ncbi:MAG: ArnT family glycosyltransferase [Candidatus Nanohaloarchaea archaeon]